jgi:hypothetical protein
MPRLLRNHAIGARSQRNRGGLRRIDAPHVIAGACCAPHAEAAHAKRRRPRAVP